MSATLGSLALAGVMQSTGAVATETVGNVLFVDFVAGTVIPQYAAATGTTAAAVEAGIASGVTIGTGGLILIGAAALAIIGAIIAWWVSTHKDLETDDTPVTTLSEVGWGDLKFSHMYRDGTYNPGSGYQYKLRPISNGTPFTGALGHRIKINDNLYLECTNSSTVIYYFKRADGTNYDSFYDGGYTYLPFLQFSHTSFSPNISKSNPAYMSIISENMSSDPLGYPPMIMSLPCTRVSGDFFFLESVIRWGGNRRGFTDIIQTLINYLITQSGIETYLDQARVRQKKKKDALEIPQLDPSQELAINTGAATLEIPNPNLDEIGKYMNEHVNNPAADPAKGFNYQPPFEVKDVQLPNPKPGDIPITPPLPAPEIPTDPVAPPQLPVLGSSSSGMVRLWNPTPEEMGEISKFMLSGDFIDQVVKLFSDPADYLLSLSLQPVTPSVSAKESIYIGSLPVPNITVAPITSQYATVDFGSIEIPAVYNSFVDYDTQFSIFLPCIGEQPLNTQDMIGSTIHLKYNVDVLTGTFAALLHVSRNTNGINLDAVLYQWQGNLAAQIPIRASSWNVGITDIAAGALAGAAGGPYGALAGAGVALGKGLLKPRISGSGSLSGNAGLLGIQYPYLIINRPRTATPSNYKGYSGVSTSEVSRLGDLSGYTMVQDTHLQGIPATSDELDEILSLLKGGVIL